MGMKEYFSENRPKPKFFLGDRVTGKFNGIRYMAVVGNDRMVSESEGPVVTLHLMLPLRVGDTVYNYLTVKQKDIKLLKEF
jgi:hypothetical protein